jgi:hypothetical protein
MATVDLDRRFVEWTKDADADPELWARFRLSDGTLTWDDVLARRRVVVLAEGGSGKSTEFKRQLQLQAAAGKDAWYLTVQAVAENGIDDSIPPVERTRFREWRTSDRAGWLFVDSVDEAKLNRIRFERALRQLAAGLVGAESRAHVIISGRHTDWEVLRDLNLLNEELKIPVDIPREPQLTWQERLIRVLRRDQPKASEKRTESALVTVMVPLDAQRVRQFAEGQGVSGAQEFLDHVERANLWQFARRPLDLVWLLDHWRRFKRLGSLAETVQTSLTERLRETDAQRDRQGVLDATRAMAALERIGASMVFGRIATIEIPDSELNLDRSGSALSLSDALPDYTGPERGDLLTRPVFDPATFGRTRFHNDNFGVVRGYLAARWLLRLRRNNLPVRKLFALLFGDPYGAQVVIPSTRETAAWLSLWDRDVGREVAKREPWVLLTGGDPGSLPADTRCAVLRELAHRMVAEDFLLPPLDADSLTRFSSEDLSESVRELWCGHPDHAELRSLLLRLILLGKLRSCADLATDMALATDTERRLRLLAGRALTATADDSTRRRYANFVLGHLSELPNALIWDAVDGLFPTFIDLDDLLSITGTIDVCDSDGALGFEWQGPELVSRLASTADVERLLRGLLSQLGGQPGDFGHRQDPREDAYYPAIGALACQLMKRSQPEEAPALAIEAGLRLGKSRRSTTTPWQSVTELPKLLLESSARRRIVFWEAARRLAEHPALAGRPLEYSYQMGLLGWAPRLCQEDLEWLLGDGPRRVAANERRLTIHAALEVAQQPGAAPELRSHIESVARSDPEMETAFVAATTPSARSAEQQASEAELQEHLMRNDAAQSELERGWIEFVAGLRANPYQLRQLLPASDESADSRLVSLWRLLDGAGRTRNHFAIDTLADVEPILGVKLTDALREALIGFWRSRNPRLASSRQDPERNVINTLDCMGIAGITLEAHGDPGWATRLTPDDARRAVGYATLELNGFPTWLLQLACVHPVDTAAVLGLEIDKEIAGGAAGTHFKTLQSLSYADDGIKRLMSSPLLDQLQQRQDMSVMALAFLLEVVSGHLSADRRGELFDLARARLTTDDPGAVALYLSAAFAMNSDAAGDALGERLDALPAGDQRELVERLLPLLFGDRLAALGPNPKAISFSCLVRLVRIAYAAVRVGEDRQHAGGTAYSPDQRDRAEWARNAAFKGLIDIGGRATFDALLSFRDIPEFPIPRARLESLAVERAAADAESDPWCRDDAMQFEQSHEPSPRTPLDLQRLALSRLADIQDALTSSDFSQAETLQGQPNENAVQKWVADRLDLLKGTSYSVERESRVIDEKEPDVRLRAKQSHATLPIEIKLTDRWSLADLEAALVIQLCGKYLRATDARHGVLLIVHRQPRTEGWRRVGSWECLDFKQLTDHLKRLAAGIAGRDSSAPQPEIAVLDVSGVAAAARSPANGGPS